MQEFEEHLGPDLHGRPGGQNSSEVGDIKFIGSPILATNPATNDLLQVEEFLSHPLVAGRYFYTLPAALWRALLDKLSEEEFDAKMLQLEQALAAVGGDHSRRVGVWRRHYVDYQGLRPTSAFEFSDEEQVRAWGLNPLELRDSLRLYAERDATPLERFRRGYAGWLLTSPQFLDEHDSLLADHAEAVRRWGTHLAGVFVPRDMLLPCLDPTGDAAWQSFNTACNAFFARWRLRSLAGPYLPVPLEALMAGLFPWTVVEQLMRAGGVFFLPDTMPIPSRDQLRGLLDHALHRGEQPAHLAEWLALVRSDNSARNQLDRLGRLFEVQHYFRILRQRHRNAFEGNVGRIEVALSQFFNNSESTVHADLIEIRRRLGNTWLERPWPI
jgi:hypothetical protein